MPVRLYTKQEVAEILRVHVGTVSRWINAKGRARRLGCVRVGRTVRITDDHLTEFLRLKPSRRNGQA